MAPIQGLWGCIWIFDSYYKGCVELWSREKDLAGSVLSIEGLKSRYMVEECSFNTIFGTF